MILLLKVTVLLQYVNIALINVAVEDEFTLQEPYIFYVSSRTALLVDSLICWKICWLVGCTVQLVSSLLLWFVHSLMIDNSNQWFIVVNHITMVRVQFALSLSSECFIQLSYGIKIFRTLGRKQEINDYDSADNVCIDRTITDPTLHNKHSLNLLVIAPLSYPLAYSLLNYCGKLCR